MSTIAFPPYLTDEEIDEICAPLKIGAAKRKRLERMGMLVKLKPNGTLVFKWNETQVKTREVLELTTEQPLYLQKSGRSGMTHWMTFIKPAHKEAP